MDDPQIRAFLSEVYPRLVAALTLVCRSRPAAEDAVQEALARAWQRQDAGLHIESLTAWVTSVSLNLSRSMLRRLRAEQRAKDRSAVRAVPNPIDAAESNVDLGRALERLPRRQREATILRYYLDLDVAEVAEAMGVHEGTVKTSLHRARRSLAEALSTEPEDDNEEVERHAPTG